MSTTSSFACPLVYTNMGPAAHAPIPQTVGHFIMIKIAFSKPKYAKHVCFDGSLENICI